MISQKNLFVAPLHGCLLIGIQTTQQHHKIDFTLVTHYGMILRKIFYGKKRNMSLPGWHFYRELPPFLKGYQEKKKKGKSRPSFEVFTGKKEGVEKSKVIIHLLL